MVNHRKSVPQDLSQLFFLGRNLQSCRCFVLVPSGGDGLRTKFSLFCRAGTLMAFSHRSEKSPQILIDQSLQGVYV